MQSKPLFSRYVDYRPLRLKDIEAAAAEMGVSLNGAIGARRKHLHEELAVWLDTDVDPITWDVLCKPMVRKILDDLLRLANDLHWRNRPPRKGM